jgi:hypothetical protein
MKSMASGAKLKKPRIAEATYAKSIRTVATQSNAVGVVAMEYVSTPPKR